MEKLNEGAFSEALFEDGYKAIKKLLNPEFDIDLKELAEKGFYLWETEKFGGISVFLENGNVCTITCRTDDDYFGECSTYDFDEYGIASCFCSAMRDLISDLEDNF